MVPHLDVVPANPAGWSVDPFAAEINDGMVWGRGAVDMLNVTAAMTVVFGRFLTGALPPLPGDLILAAVADEEAGSAFGAKFLTEEHWDLVASRYVLTEVAYPSLSTPAGPAYPVTVGEKGPHWTVLRAKGTPGHGSAPFMTDNALETLTAALAGVFGASSPISITEEWRDFIDVAGLSDELTDPDRVDAALTELASVDPRLARFAHASTHLTVSPNMMKAGVKANVIPDHAEASVDIRALPGTGRGDVELHLRKAMAEAGDRVEVVPVSDHPANVSNRDNPLWSAIAQTIEEQTGSRRIIPTITPVATDGRFWRDRGGVAYGVGLFDDRIGFSEFTGLFHGNDERVSVDSLNRTVDLLSGIIERFGELTRLNA
jgi:acetylornithine deacetylase/succinyl-diaminopimelate desuccinylase-like protein